jgi:hypothetical protein
MGMLLDHLFGQPLPKILKIVRKNGEMKTVTEVVPLPDQNEEPSKQLFPISKERK